MIAVRHVLSPALLLTPERTALAAVAALAALATPMVLTLLPIVDFELFGGLPAALLMVALTVGLSVVLARRALQARTSFRARAWLLCGGFLAGSLDALTSCSISMLLGGIGRFHPLRPVDLLTGCIAFGGSLGCVFGVAYAPVVATAVRARVAPSVDAPDRVLVAAGTSLLAVAALSRLTASQLVGPLPAELAMLLGALAVLLAVARLVVRVRLLCRVRDGAEPGFHVVPRTFGEDESALVPLVRTDLAPLGMLAATGIAAPYRGARGVFKLALAPLPDELFRLPLLRLVRGALGEVARTLATAMLGAVGLWMVSMAVLFATIATSGLGVDLGQR